MSAFMTTEHYDALETRDPADREAACWPRCPARGARAGHSAAMAARLAGIDAGGVTSRAALAQLPVTRKSELLERQQAGTQRAAATPSAASRRSAGAPGRCAPARRVYQSPGPIYEPEGTAPDYWRRRAPCSPPAFAPATWCTTASATT
jgi:phenylacetate-CoA ligase